jgi:hypothetical protein
VIVRAGNAGAKPALQNGEMFVLVRGHVTKRTVDYESRGQGVSVRLSGNVFPACGRQLFKRVNQAATLLRRQKACIGEKLLDVAHGDLGSLRL